MSTIVVNAHRVLFSSEYELAVKPPVPASIEQGARRQV